MGNEGFKEAQAVVNPMPSLEEQVMQQQAPHQTVKFCTTCGYKITNGERFCPGCGSSVQ